VLVTVFDLLNFTLDLLHSIIILTVAYVWFRPTGLHFHFVMILKRFEL